MDPILEQILEIISTDKTTYFLKTVCEGISIDYNYLVTTIDISDDEEKILIDSMVKDMVNVARDFYGERSDRWIILN